MPFKLFIVLFHIAQASGSDQLPPQFNILISTAGQFWIYAHLYLRFAGWLCRCSPGSGRCRWSFFPSFSSFPKAFSSAHGGLQEGMGASVCWAQHLLQTLPCSGCSWVPQILHAGGNPAAVRELSRGTDPSLFELQVLQALWSCSSNSLFNLPAQFLSIHGIKFSSLLDLKLGREILACQSLIPRRTVPYRVLGSTAWPLFPSVCGAAPSSHGARGSPTIEASFHTESPWTREFPYKTRSCASQPSNPAFK